MFSDKTYPLPDRPKLQRQELENYKSYGDQKRGEGEEKTFLEKMKRLHKSDK